MKILLDHNLDRRLKNYLTGHEIATIQEEGWADLLNGELLSIAETNHYNVLLTADANIKNQQNISNLMIAILVLRASNNRIATHLEMIVDINRALSRIQPSEVLEVFHKKMSGK